MYIFFAFTIRPTTASDEINGFLSSYFPIISLCCHHAFKGIMQRIQATLPRIALVASYPFILGIYQDCLFNQSVYRTSPRAFKPNDNMPPFAFQCLEPAFSTKVN